MSLSLYIHIPYCLQRCRYCDFTTFESSQIMPPEDYVALILKELRQRHHFVSIKDIRSIYFGGGTPSLISADLIVSILEEIASLGFRSGPNCEVTIEINPATIDPQKVQVYTQAGVNRFSVGAQTFNDRLLKLCGRRHTAQDTRETLDLLRSLGLNYSFDLLFALPTQSLKELEQDLYAIEDFDPPHLSAYCLTVPESHPMALGRAPENEQIVMFQQIERSLLTLGLEKYEISNFSVVGRESIHNMAYWTDRPYWGLGLSAHSYLPLGPFGVRFWNPKSFEDYIRQVAGPGPVGPASETEPDILRFFPPSQVERLKLHEALTDYCHTQLRLRRGLNLTALRNKFSTDLAQGVSHRSQEMLDLGLLCRNNDQLHLSPAGELVSNRVFEHFYFQSQDV